MEQGGKEQWQQEYEEFCSGTAAPPAELSQKLRGTVFTDLHPAAWLVFAKLCAAAILSGAVSLAFCPQFGLGFTRQHTALMHLFMSLGETGCAAACGAIFLTAGAIAAAALLRLEEVQLIRRTKFLQIPALALLALSLLVCAGAEVLAVTALLWWLGAVAAGIAAFEIGYAGRLYLWRRAE